MLLVSTACHVTPAPSDVDGLSRWLWLNRQGASDQELIDAIRKLDAAAGPLDENRQESISRLQKGDAKAAGAIFEGEIEKAAGMLLLNRIKCPLDKVEKLFIQKDQKALHANYTTYDRNFETSLNDYFDRKTSLLAWTSVYELKILIPVFKPTVPGGARFVPAAAAGDGFTGPAFIGHAYFNGAAEVVSGGDDAFKQNYQVQVFYERAPGDVVHMYALWQELKVGFLTSDGAEVAATTLDSLKKSDDDFEKHCND